MPTPPPDDHAARLARHAAAVQAETAAPVVFPQIHDNGSGAKYLAESYALAADAVQETAQRLCRTAPNGRDYPTDEAYRAARLDHERRLDLLGKVRAEYVALYEHCRAATRERTG